MNLRKRLVMKRETRLPRPLIIHEQKDEALPEAVLAAVTPPGLFDKAGRAKLAHLIVWPSTSGGNAIEVIPRETIERRIVLVLERLARKMDLIRDVVFRDEETRNLICRAAELAIADRLAVRSSYIVRASGDPQFGRVVMDGADITDQVQADLEGLGKLRVEFRKRP